MQVYLGIDWSMQKHAAYFSNEKGAALQYLEVAHSLAGLCQLDAARHKLGVSAQECIVGSNPTSSA